jgi:hypothetical protein
VQRSFSVGGNQEGSQRDPAVAPEFACHWNVFDCLGGLQEPPVRPASAFRCVALGDVKPGTPGRFIEAVDGVTRQAR